MSGGSGRGKETLVAYRAGLALAVAGFALFGSPSLSLASGDASRSVQARVEIERLAGVQIPFVANSGQTDPAVAYYASTFAGTVFVTRDGRIVYSLPGEPPTASDARPPDTKARRGGWSLTETIVGGQARPRGSDPAATRVNYFFGNDPAGWRSRLPTFDRDFARPPGTR
jgi:hypothetical protein